MRPRNAILTAWFMAIGVSSACSTVLKARNDDHTETTAERRPPGPPLGRVAPPVNPEIFFWDPGSWRWTGFDFVWAPGP